MISERETHHEIECFLPTTKRWPERSDVCGKRRQGTTPFAFHTWRVFSLQRSSNLTIKTTGLESVPFVQSKSKLTQEVTLFQLGPYYNLDFIATVKDDVCQAACQPSKALRDHACAQLAVRHARVSVTTAEQLAQIAKNTKAGT